jgi:hypothetical protein
MRIRKALLLSACALAVTTVPAAADPVSIGLSIITAFSATTTAAALTANAIITLGITVGEVVGEVAILAVVTGIPYLGKPISWSKNS